jgi:hypothetical protein
MLTQGWRLCKTKIGKYGQWVRVQKLSAVVATANFQQKEWVWKNVCWFLSEIKSEKHLLSCSQCRVHRKSWMKITYVGGRKRATSTCSCWRVSVQRCSVQCKGNNLIGVTTVEGGTTIGTTALVYWQLHSSLYTGAVQGYWSTPNWSDCRQWCRQVSTVLLLSIFLAKKSIYCIFEGETCSFPFARG